MYTYVGCSADYERSFSLQPNSAGPLPCKSDQLDLLRLIANISISRGAHRAAWISTPWSMIWKFFRALNWGKLMFWKVISHTLGATAHHFSMFCVLKIVVLYILSIDLFLKEKFPISTDFIFYWILITEGLFK